MANKLVKEHITSYVLESINDKSSPNHYQLEKSCLTDSKISDIEHLFNMKENMYRILITFMFGNDTFINDISVAQEYYHPITTQKFLPTKKQIFPSSSSSNNEQSSSSNIKKIKLKIFSKVHGYKSLEKQMSTKKNQRSLKKRNWHRGYTKYFFEAFNMEFYN